MTEAIPASPRADCERCGKSVPEGVLYGEKNFYPGLCSNCSRKQWREEDPEAYRRWALERHLRKNRRRWEAASPEQQREARRAARIKSFNSAHRVLDELLKSGRAQSGVTIQELVRELPGKESPHRIQRVPWSAVFSEVLKERSFRLLSDGRWYPNG